MPVWSVNSKSLHRFSPVDCVSLSTVPVEPAAGILWNIGSQHEVNSCLAPQYLRETFNSLRHPNAVTIPNPEKYKQCNPGCLIAGIFQSSVEFTLWGRSITQSIQPR